MCKQCDAAGEVVRVDFLKGHSLIVAREDVPGDDMTPEWRKGEYAIVFCHDPDVFIKGTPVFDLTEDMTEDEVNALKSDSPEWISHEQFHRWVDENRDRFSLAPVTAWKLVCGALAKGYDIEKSGHIETWILDKVAREHQRIQDGGMTDEAIMEIAQADCATLAKKLELLGLQGSGHVVIFGQGFSVGAPINEQDGCDDQHDEGVTEHAPFDLSDFREMAQKLRDRLHADIEVGDLDEGEAETFKMGPVSVKIMRVK